MMSLKTRHSVKKNRSRAFTLIELVIVMFIIAAMLTMIMPYAARSDDNLKLRQHALGMAEALRYAVSTAENTGRPARIRIDTKTKSWSFQTLDPANPQLLLPTYHASETPQYLGDNIHILEIEGFTVEVDAYYLLFDPRQPWPSARVSLATRDMVQTVYIQDKRIEIEESQM